MMGHDSPGRMHHVLSIVGLQERRIDILGKLERFRDQGTEMCKIASIHLSVGNSFHHRQEGERWYHRARAVGAAHGFFSVECDACQGLGLLSGMDGRTKEAVELLQNALAAAPLGEDDDGRHEVSALMALIEVLLRNHLFDEVEP